MSDLFYPDNYSGNEHVDVHFLHAKHIVCTHVVAPITGFIDVLLYVIMPY